MIELLLATILGLLIGSFLNVLIIRIPQGESVVFPPSHCTRCKRALRWYHNIPLLSWLFLKGRCAYCKEKISLQYPIVEFLSAVIFFLVFFKNGFSIYSFIIALSFDLLLALSVIDLRYKAVPDSINLLAAFLAIFSSSTLLTNLQNALLAAGAFSMLRFVVSYYVSKKEEIFLKEQMKKAPWLKEFFPRYVMVEAMGEGDIMVGFALGAILGKVTLIAIFLAALIALPASLFNKLTKRDNQLPFIPFLALGGFIAFFFQEALLRLVNG